MGLEELLALPATVNVTTAGRSLGIGRDKAARVEVRPWHRPDRRHWVLARRSVSRPDEISYYIAYCPAETTLDELIRVAGSRWAVEECFQTAKQECGLDDCGQSRNGSSQLIHLSLAEIRRLITRLTDRRPAPVDHVLHWSTWRRRRQRQARISHYKRRGHSP